MGSHNFEERIYIPVEGINLKAVFTKCHKSERGKREIKQKSS